MVSVTVQAQSHMEMGPHGESCAEWVSSHFAAGATPPFSFRYGGVESSRLLPKWKFSAADMVSGQGEDWRSYLWEERGGMQVECRVRTFGDFDAMEWVVILRNNSRRDSKRVSRFRSLDLCQVSDAPSGEWTLFHADGAQFGPGDFHPETTPFAVGDTVMMYPSGGRSSSHKMPYFNVLTPTGGMVYAIGWTGEWLAEVGRPSPDRMRVQAGLKTFDACLRPGEELRMPSVVLLPWQGDDRMDGQNVFRRLVLAHYHPKVNGEALRVPLFNNFSNTGAPRPCDEYVCMTDDYAAAVVRKHKMFGTLADGFWLDAGWYSRARDWDGGYWWHNAVGNWTPDPERFPEGLAPVADAVHEAGCKFMLWFEPERANVDSDWAHEHPEFMLAESGESAVPLDCQVDSAFIVNLGDPDALKFVCESMVQYLTDAKVDCYRQDFNISPERFWLNNDEPGRAGVCEVKYVNGLYKYLDYLHEQLPWLMIDNCAGGGRRLDIEMTRRAIPMWREDYSGKPDANQCHTYHLSQWLPVHCTNIVHQSRYGVLSSLGAGCVFTWGVVNNDISIPEQKRIIALCREVAPYWLEDFYPLSGYGDVTGDDMSIAYQLNRPSDGSGYVFAFRRPGCGSDEIVVKLRGLDPGREYVLEERHREPGRDTMPWDAYFGIVADTTAVSAPDGASGAQASAGDAGNPFSAGVSGRVIVSGARLMEGYTLRLANPGTALLLRYGTTPVEDRR